MNQVEQQVLATSKLASGMQIGETEHSDSVSSAIVLLIAGKAQLLQIWKRKDCVEGPSHSRPIQLSSYTMQIFELILDILVSGSFKLS